VNFLLLFLQFVRAKCGKNLAFTHDFQEIMNNEKKKSLQFFGKCYANTKKISLVLVTFLVDFFYWFLENKKCLKGKILILSSLSRPKTFDANSNANLTRMQDCINVCSFRHFSRACDQNQRFLIFLRFIS